MVMVGAQKMDEAPAQWDKLREILQVLALKLLAKHALIGSTLLR